MFAIVLAVFNLFMSSGWVWVASGSFGYGLAVLSFGTFLFVMYTDSD